MTSPPEQPAAPSPGLLPSPACPAHDGAWHITGEDFRHDPGAVYQAKRAQYGSVAPVVLEGGVFAWLVLDCAELKEVTQRGEIFSRDSRLWRPREGGIPQGWPLEPHTRWQKNAVFATGDEHTRLRGALTRLLGKVRAPAVRGFTLANGHRLIDAFCRRGEAELVSQYAMSVTVLTLMRMFGFPATTEQSLQTAITTLLACGDDASAAAQSVMDLVDEQISRRRRDPQADVTTWLIEEHGAMWDGADRAAVDEEIRGQIWLTVNAGHGATAIWIANALEQLVSQRDIQAGMFAGWMDIQGALRATLWDRTPLANIIGRYATRDALLAGRRIRAGDLLLLSLAGANTDPCRGTRSDRDDFTVHNESYFSFGNGPHECPVPGLAHTIAQAAIEAVWDRIPDVRLTDADPPCSGSCRS
ncbi:hypothetical protein ACFZDK_49900 [Streptomyces sp. NPDC007901]|uniref:hypothetical protein n=1 Tax=Streptomyces sp. NPDC007901 TaxID=3364785 RepID=UPI0036E4C0B4